MINYIKTAYLKPKNSYLGENMTVGQTIKYFLFLLLIMLLIIISQMIPIYRGLNEDLAEISQEVPEFNVEGSSLNSDAESYIHLTDSMVFIFDANDEIQDADVQSTVTGLQAPILLSLESDQLTFSVMGNEQSISFESIGNFTSQDFTSVLDSLTQFSAVSFLIAFAVLAIVTGFSYIFELLSISIIAYAIALFSRKRMGFFNAFKVTLLATTIPLTIIAIFNIFGFTSVFDFQLRFIFTLILFVLTIFEKHKKEVE